MNILIINQGHTDNVGDIAIARSIDAVAVNRLHRTVCAPYYFALVPDTLPGASLQCERVLRHIPTVRERLMIAQIKKLLDGERFDAAIIGGGELLGGSFDSFSVSFLAWTKVLREMQVPIHATGLSGSVPDKHWVKRRYKEALNNCSTICVRDKTTLDLVQSYYGIQNCMLAPDVVFSYGLTHAIPARNKRQPRNRVMCVPAPFTKETTRYLGINSLDEFCDYIIEVTENAIDGMQISEIVFTSTTSEDNEVVNTLVDRYQKNHPNNCSAVGILPNGNLDDFLFELSDVKLVISGRMHACILGLLSGCDYVVIPCKTKLKTFASEYPCGFDLNRVERQTLECLSNLFVDLEKRASANLSIKKL